MIKVNVGNPKPLKYINCIVLNVTFMHGDADSYTHEALVAETSSAEQLAIIKAVWDMYNSSKDRWGRRRLTPSITLEVAGIVYSSPSGDDGYEDMELEYDMGVDADLSRMFPWDEQQSSIDMYENRAIIEKCELTYYDAAAHPFHVTLTETE